MQPTISVLSIGFAAMISFARLQMSVCFRASGMLRVQRALSVPLSTNSGIFSELISEEALVQELKSQGIESATTIQKKAFDQIANGHDTLLGAETGSGKTLAYTLPLLVRYGMRSSPDSKQRGMILAPTAELCKQIENMTGRYYTALDGRESRSIALGKTHD